MFFDLIEKSPNWITKSFTNTVLFDYYMWYKLKFSEKINRIFEVNSEEIELTIPKYADDWYSEEHEPVLTQELLENLKPDSIFYDIGTQFGYYLKLALIDGVFPANIYGFEMSYYRYKFCKHYNLPDRGLNLKNKKVGAPEQNNVITLNNYIKDNPTPDVIKIDVEGMEANVLQGLNWVLEENRPVLFVEVHPQKLRDRNKSIKEIVDFLKRFDFELKFTNHRNEEANWRSLDYFITEKNEFLVKAF